MWQEYKDFQYRVSKKQGFYDIRYPSGFKSVIVANTDEQAKAAIDGVISHFSEKK